MSIEEYINVLKIVHDGITIIDNSRLVTIKDNKNSISGLYRVTQDYKLDKLDNINFISSYSMAKIKYFIHELDKFIILINTDDKFKILDKETGDTLYEIDDALNYTLDMVCKNKYTIVKVSIEEEKHRKWQYHKLLLVLDNEREGFKIIFKKEADDFLTEATDKSDNVTIISKKKTKSYSTKYIIDKQGKIEVSKIEKIMNLQE